MSEPTGCQARHIREHGDWCGKPTIPGGGYCRIHTCDVRGCKERNVVEWPLLRLRLCKKHNTRKYAPAGAFDEPDDFDLPW